MRDVERYSPFDKFPEKKISLLDQDQLPLQTLGLDLTILSDVQLRELQLSVNQELSWRKDSPEVIEIFIPNAKPILVVGIGDTHFGGESTDYTHLKSFRDETMKFGDNVYYVLLGDGIEGFGKYPTIDLRTTIPDYQIEAFIDFVDPIRDRVIGMVANYFAHEGHIADNGKIDLWAILAKRLGVRKINNGSVIRIRNLHATTNLAIMHDPGKRSTKDPVHGNRIMTDYLGADAGFSAHFHTAGVELVTNYSGRSSKSPVSEKALIAIGTAKGSNPNLPPDMYGTRRAMTPGPSKLTQSLIIRTPNQDKKQLTPNFSAETGLYLYSAFQVLDDLMAQGNMHTEVVEEIRAKSEKKVGKPAETVEFRPRLSEIQRGATSAKEEREWVKAQEDVKHRLASHEIEIGDNKSAFFDRPYSNVYGNLVYDLVTPLPVSIHFPANINFGSASSNIKDFTRYLDQISGPYDFKIWLRNILDPGVAGFDDRKKYLDQVGEWMKKGTSLGLLLSSTITSAGWKHPTKHFRSAMNDVESKDDLQDLYDSLALPPATYLHDLTNVKLFNNLSWITLRVKSAPSHDPKPTTFIGVDSTGRTSSAKPLWGLESLFIDVVNPKPIRPTIVGGNAPGSGVGQSDQAIFISPGWWSMATMGRSKDVILGGPPEKAEILLSTLNGVLRFPVASLTEGKDKMNALTLRAGIDHGLIDINKIMSSR